MALEQSFIAIEGGIVGLIILINVISFGLLDSYGEKVLIIIRVRPDESEIDEDESKDDELEMDELDEVVVDEFEVADEAYDVELEEEEPEEVEEPDDDE